MFVSTGSLTLNVQGISKLSGQAKASTYPQPEGTLGEAMLTYGNKLQDYDRE